MSKEYYVSGDDVDFDNLNEQMTKTAHDIDPQKESDIIQISEASLSQAYGNFAKGYGKPGSDGKGLEYVETPAEKIARLKKELGLLENEMRETIKKESQTKIANLDEEQKQLNEIKDMQENINIVLQNPDFKKLLNSGEEVGDDAKNTVFNIASQVREQAAESLLTRLQTLSKSPADQANVVFKLHLDKRSADTKQDIKFEDLERRINILEKIFGVTPLQDDMLTRLNQVQKTMDSLDEGRIESNKKRISSIISELDALSSKKQLLNVNDENLKKLSTLYENFKKIQPIGEELHGLIDRLECLKLIHEESALINEKFKNLKDLEGKLTVKLKENHEELNKVSNNFVQNVDTINKNLLNLEERIKKL